jgi:hypothetical protein
MHILPIISQVTYKMNDEIGFFLQNLSSWTLGN